MQYRKSILRSGRRNSEQFKFIMAKVEAKVDNETETLSLTPLLCSEKDTKHRHLFVDLEFCVLQQHIPKKKKAYFGKCRFMVYAVLHSVYRCTAGISNSRSAGQRDCAMLNVFCIVPRNIG